MTNLKELEQRFQASQEWNAEDLKELAVIADMVEEWESSDGETFEAVAEKMATKVGIALY